MTTRKTIRTVNKEVFKEYIALHWPVGLEKLAVESTIPSYSINRFLRLNKAPNHLVQEKICSAMGKTLDQVFPINKQRICNR